MKKKKSACPFQKVQKIHRDTGLQGSAFCKDQGPWVPWYQAKGYTEYYGKWEGPSSLQDLKMLFPI